MLKKISFVVPAYNAEKTIGRCLSNLASQNYPKNKYEIIVVDDGSTDKTAEIVSKFNRVRLIRQRHRGPAVARNLGWTRARHNIIVFVDSDIALEENCLKKFLKEIRGCDILIMGKKSIDIELDIKKFYPPKDITIIKKNVLISVKGYSKIFPWAAAEDTDMLIKALKRGYRCKSINCGYTQLQKHKSSIKKILRRWISNLIMNLKNLDTKIARQWLLRKMTGFIFLEHLNKRLNIKR